MIGGLVALMLAFSPQVGGAQRANCFTALSKLPAPAGYRYPMESDVSDYWQYFREEYGGRQASCASADLTADGVADYVSFAIRTPGPGFAVVILYSGPKRYEPHIVWTDSGRIYPSRRW